MPNSRRRDDPAVVAAKGNFIMFANSTKTLVAALVIAGTSLAFVANAHAAPVNTQSQAEQAWMNRASNPNTNGIGN